MKQVQTKLLKTINTFQMHSANAEVNYANYLITPNNFLKVDV